MKNYCHEKGKTLYFLLLAKGCHEKGKTLYYLLLAEGCPIDNQALGIQDIPF